MTPRNRCCFSRPYQHRHGRRRQEGLGEDTGDAARAVRESTRGCRLSVQSGGQSGVSASELGGQMTVQSDVCVIVCVCVCVCTRAQARSECVCQA
jgi:hypothetical protein